MLVEAEGTHARQSGRRFKSVAAGAASIGRQGAKLAERSDLASLAPWRLRRSVHATHSPVYMSANTRLTARNVSEQSTTPFTVSTPSRARPMNQWYW